MQLWKGGEGGGERHDSPYICAYSVLGEMYVNDQAYKWLVLLAIHLME